MLADTPLDPKTHYHNVLSKADVTTLRERFSRHCNEALRQTDATRRFDPRSYLEMGIDQEPGEHLGGARSSDVGAGLHDDIHIANVRKAWDGERRRMQQRHGETRYAIDADIHALDLQIAAVDQRHHDWLKTLRDDYVTAQKEAYAATVEIGRLGLEDRINRSGAEHLERHMLAWIADARSGKSTLAKRRDLPLAEARLAHAQRHLAELDRALEPWAEAAADRIKRRDAAETRASIALKAFKEVVAEAAQADRNVQSAEQARVAEAPAAPTLVQPARAATSTKLPSPYTAQPRDRFAQFNALIGRIRDANPALPIVLDQALYLVPALPEADRQLLQDPDFRQRAQAALAAMCKHQDMAIERLLAFARAHGEPCLFAGIRRDGSAAPQSIANLYTRYRQHPSFRARIDAAHAVYETMRERERATTATPSLPAPNSVPVTRTAPSPVVAVNIETPAPSMPMYRATESMPEAVEAIAQSVPPLPKPEPAAGPVVIAEPEAAPPSKVNMAPVPLPPVMPPAVRQADDDVSVRAKSDRAAPDETASAKPIMEQAPVPVLPVAQPTPLSPFAGLSTEEAAARKLAAQAKKAAVRDAARKIAANAAGNIAKPLAPAPYDKAVAVEAAAQPELLPASAPATVAPPVARTASFEAPSPVTAEPSVPSLPSMVQKIEDTLAAFRMNPAFLALLRSERQAFDDRAGMVTLLLGNGNLHLGFDEHGQVRSKSRLEARLGTRSTLHVEAHAEWVCSVIGELAGDAAGRALLLELARATAVYAMPEGPWHPKIWHTPDGRPAQQAAAAAQRRNLDRNQ
ncbi:MAG: MobA/MobL family protein [Sphingomonadales bacterium]|nr:MobA/MobL family protein [Sphingomonadales bacterium]MDE2172230.1 MobA/MobL family protein [Sphingomonadales bacterium]